MTSFIIGAIVGVVLGMIIMSLCVVSKRSDKRALSKYGDDTRGHSSPGRGA